MSSIFGERIDLENEISSDNNESPIKELELEFTVNSGEVGGFVFRQKLASPDGYMYEVTTDEGDVHYEVFQRKEQKEGDSVIAGVKVHYEPKVLYPKSGAFGQWAWCITDYNKAKAWFDELEVN